MSCSVYRIDVKKFLRFKRFLRLWFNAVSAIKALFHLMAKNDIAADSELSTAKLY